MPRDYDLSKKEPVVKSECWLLDCTLQPHTPSFSLPLSFVYKPKCHVFDSWQPLLHKFYDTEDSWTWRSKFSIVFIYYFLSFRLKLSCFHLESDLGGKSTESFNALLRALSVEKHRDTIVVYCIIYKNVTQFLFKTNSNKTDLSLIIQSLSYLDNSESFHLKK